MTVSVKMRPPSETGEKMLTDALHKTEIVYRKLAKYRKLETP